MKERTFSIIKPDAMKARQAGEILSRLEDFFDDNPGVRSGLVQACQVLLGIEKPVGMIDP